MAIVFLDDIESRVDKVRENIPDVACIMRDNVESFIKVLREFPPGSIDMLVMDHDLGAGTTVGRGADSFPFDMNGHNGSDAIAWLPDRFKEVPILVWPPAASDGQMMIDKLKKRDFKLVTYLPWSHADIIPLIRMVLDNQRAKAEVRHEVAHVDAELG